MRLPKQPGFYGTIAERLGGRGAGTKPTRLRRVISETGAKFLTECNFGLIGLGDAVIDGEMRVSPTALSRACDAEHPLHWHRRVDGDGQFHADWQEETRSTALSK